MHLDARRNEYADTLGPLFDAIPKAVFAAIAISALTTGGEQLSDAKGKIMKEFETLAANGIVQSPTAKARGLALL